MNGKTVSCPNDNNMACSNEKVRLSWIDFIKGIGILLVMLGHATTDPNVRLIVYGFHLPLFFFVSGYLYNSKHDDQTTKAFFVKTFKQYMKPYFIYSVIGFVIDIVVRGGILKETITIKSMIGSLTGIAFGKGYWELTYTWGALWFLPALFVTVNLMHFIFQQRLKKYRMLLCCVVGPALSLILSSLNGILPRLPWSIDTAFMALFFMYTGFVCKEKGIVKDIHKKGIPLVVLIVGTLLLIGISAIVVNNYEVAFVSNRYGNPLLMIAGATSITIAVFVLVECAFSNISDCKITKLMVFLGKNTVPIMAFHYVMLHYLKNSAWFKNLFGDPVSWIVMFFVDVAYMVVLILAIKWAKRLTQKRKG